LIGEQQRFEAGAGGGDIGNAGVGVLPQGEELLVILAGLGFVAEFLVDQPQPIEAPGVDIAGIDSAVIQDRDFAVNITGFFPSAGL